MHESLVKFKQWGYLLICFISILYLFNSLNNFTQPSSLIRSTRTNWGVCLAKIVTLTEHFWCYLLHFKLSPVTDYNHTLRLNVWGLRFWKQNFFKSAVFGCIYNDAYTDQTPCLSTHSCNLKTRLPFCNVYTDKTTLKSNVEHITKRYKNRKRIILTRLHVDMWYA